MSDDYSQDFLGITRTYRNGGSPYARVFIQPGVETVENVKLPEITVEIPIKSMNLTPEEQKEIEEIVAKAVDMGPIIEWAKKLDAMASPPSSDSAE